MQAPTLPSAKPSNPRACLDNVPKTSPTNLPIANRTSCTIPKAPTSDHPGKSTCGYCGIDDADRRTMVRALDSAPGTHTRMQDAGCSAQSVSGRVAPSKGLLHQRCTKTTPMLHHQARRVLVKSSSESCVRLHPALHRVCSMQGVSCQV